MNDELPADWSMYSWAYRNLIAQDREWTPTVLPRTVTASANVNPLDDLVLVDPTSGSVTMTLETAVACDGRRHTFKKTVAANSMIVDGNGSETIDGAATVTMTDQHGFITIESDGTNWRTISQGTLNPTFGTVTLTSGQIVFPATQVPSAGANTLDDYEEGTWTPAFTFATPGDLAVGYAEQVGSYTKIGNLVRAAVNLNISTFTHTTAVGNAQITGHPFAAANVASNNHRGALSWGGITKANYTNVVTALAPTATLATLSAAGSGQAAASVMVADMPTGGTVSLRGVLVYQSD